MRITHERIPAITIADEVFDKLTDSPIPYLVIPVYCYILRFEEDKYYPLEEEKISSDLKMGLHDVLWALKYIESHKLLSIKLS